jgi:ABC-type lipoprotein release transport system permease subunit
MTASTGRLLFRLARRNVARNRRRTAMILAAVGVGLWAMLVFAAFIHGWSRDVTRNAVRTLTAHVQVHAPGYLQDPSVDRSMASPGAWASVLDGPEVAAWAARVRVPAVVMSARETAGVTLVGIDPDREKPVSFIGDAPVEGRGLDGAGGAGILLGRELAERLGTGPGKRVVVMTQAADGSVVDRGFPVAGVYAADRSGTEKTFVFVGREGAQDLLGLDTRISEIAVQLRDPSRVDAFVQRLRGAAGELDVQPWTELEPMAEALVALGQAWIWMFYVVMYVAMAFGLVNTLLMTVVERTREFGVVQALGMRPRWILAQVLAEAAVLLAAGMAVGGALTALTLALLRGGIDFSGLAAGAEMWGMSRVIHPVLGAGDVVSAVALIVVLASAASLYPAVRAARRVPVEAITRG